MSKRVHVRQSIGGCYSGVGLEACAAIQTEKECVDDITLGPALAHGRTAAVYAWGDGRVLKLFCDGFTERAVEHEAEVARAIHACGQPAPAVHDVVCVSGRYGIVYERVDGPTMLDMLRQKPWRLLRYARQLATLQAHMHACAGPSEIPPQRERLAGRIRRADALPDDVRDGVLSALADMPEGDRMCHGDLHPGNIVLTAMGPVIIDWMDATRGNSLADVARSSVLIMGFAQEQGAGLLLRPFLRVFHAIYLRQYYSLRPGGKRQVRRWFPIISAARLAEDIPELRQWLLDQVKRAG